MGGSGEFVRDTRYLNGRITADGRDGSLPAEAGRYRLVVARGCPWANRTMVGRGPVGGPGAGLTSAYRQIPLDMEHEWTAFHRPGAPDLYPDKLRDEIEEVAAGIYEDVNNGVYKCGFASTQAAYEEAYAKLFARLDQVSGGRASRRYLVGDTITEADVR